MTVALHTPSTAAATMTPAPPVRRIPGSFVRTHGMTVFHQLGVGQAIHEALNKTLAKRCMVAVLTPKGMGKSLRLQAAIEWHASIEAARRRQEKARFFPESVRLLRNLGETGYKDVITTVLKVLDPRAKEQKRLTRKELAVLRDEVVALLATKHVAALIVDEGEQLNTGGLRALRDLHALSRDLARETQDCSTVERPGGCGILILGAPATEDTLRSSPEWGSRMYDVERLSSLSIADAMRAMAGWLPQAQTFEGPERERWHTLVRVNVCRERDTTLRYVAAVVETYVRELEVQGRLDAAEGWGDVPVDVELLAEVAKRLEPPQLENNIRVRGRK